MEANIVIAIIGAVVAVLTYFAGQKKNSNGEAADRARFEGRVEEKLDRLQQSVDKLEARLSKNTTELYDKIDKEIKEHEMRCHNE